MNCYKGIDRQVKVGVEWPSREGSQLLPGAQCYSPGEAGRRCRVPPASPGLGILVRVAAGPFGKGSGSRAEIRGVMRPGWPPS